MEWSGNEGDLGNAVIEFICEFQGFEKNEINLESRLLNDLWIYGDDAVELILAFGRKFNVDVSEFMSSEYFLNEGSLFAPLFYCHLNFLFVKRKVIKVKDLMSAIYAGKLNHDVIGN